MIVRASLTAAVTNLTLNRVDQPLTKGTGIIADSHTSHLHPLLSSLGMVGREFPAAE